MSDTVPQRVTLGTVLGRNGERCLVGHGHRLVLLLAESVDLANSDSRSIVMYIRISAR